MCIYWPLTASPHGNEAVMAASALTYEQLYYLEVRDLLYRGPSQSIPIGPVDVSDEDAEVVAGCVKRAVERAVWAEVLRLHGTDATAQLEAFQGACWEHKAKEKAEKEKARQAAAARKRTTNGNARRRTGARMLRRASLADTDVPSGGASGVARVARRVQSAMPTRPADASEAANGLMNSPYSYPNPNFYTVSGCGSVPLQRRVLDLAWLQSETLKYERRHRFVSRAPRAAQQKSTASRGGE